MVVCMIERAPSRPGYWSPFYWTLSPGEARGWLSVSFCRSKLTIERRGC